MSSPVSKPAVPIWLRIVVLLAIVAWLYASRREPTERPSASPVAVETKPASVELGGNETEPHSSGEKTEKTQPADTDEVREAPAESESRVVVRKVVLKDQSGRVIYQGDIDLEPTLQRIADGKRLDRFRNDGSEFQNREKRLPKQPSGYYREYVVPTPGENGPGPQRQVIGREGEAWYTHDHYKSFRKVR